MKCIIYIGLLLGAALAPVRATDVGRLIPVEVISVSQDRGTIRVETDTGDGGTGKSLTEAISDMKETAAGVIYLDTAEYLILEPGTEKALPDLREYLKGSVRVCYGPEGIPLEGIADYLSIHRPQTSLNDVKAGARLPEITEENKRYQLIEK